MTRQSFSAALNRGIRAAASAQRAHVRAHTAHLREMERAAKARVKAAKEAHLGNQQAITEYRNREIETKVTAVEGLLASTLNLPCDIDLATLRKTAYESDLNNDKTLEIGDAPVRADFQPKPLGWFSSLFSSEQREQEEKQAEGKRRFEEALVAYEDRKRARAKAFEGLKQKASAHNDLIEQFDESLSKIEPNALVTYAELILNSMPLPEDFNGAYRVAILPSSMQLIVEFDIPQLNEAVPENESYRYIKQSDQVVSKKRAVKAQSALYTIAVAQLTLAILSRLFLSNRLAKIETLVLSGFVDNVDPSTGREIRPCLISLRTGREEYESLDVARVDPIACLKRLSAVVSRNPSELVAVRPVVDFNMIDSRFVAEQDVLSTLDTRPNLVELTPGEFESLITNLFQSMGLDTKLTQASRDGGVDCVAFDPRPVLGGKVVVQAKRYRHTVGVSAVRDLFGTMHNEGASKGILVTTSGFGKASYTFANGKPMELLTGENLLYLLKEHGGVDARIEFPEDWKDPPALLSD